MIRKEEIVTQAVKEQSQLHQPLEWGAGFISGANWADKTMLERACEWMNKVFFQNPFLTKKGIVSGKYDTMEEFITAFRQAMEGGAE